MDVSTVPPSPISPTEGDDLCELDVTSVAMHSVALLIGLCGLAGNGAVLCLISLNTHPVFIIGLAVIDFLFLLFVVPSALLFLVEDVSCSPVMSQVYVTFLFQLSLLSYYWVLFLPTLGILGAVTTTLCECCCRCHISERQLFLLGCALFWAFFALITVILTVTLLCPAHEQEHCRAALMSMYALYLLVIAPVVIFIIINFIKAKCGSQQQQPRRFDIVIFLAALFALLVSLWNFLQQFGYIIVSSQIDFLFTCINGSIKPFICFLVGRCWSPCSMESLRLSLQRVLGEPEETTACSNDATRDTGV